MRILVVSPIASHPQNQGNSARIAALCRQLQILGHVVHFLYYPLEGLTPEQRDAMSLSWDHFHTIPCDLPNTQRSMDNFYGIDDWYDPRLGEYALRLHTRWHFDAVLVNYVWFSGVLNSLPDDIFKIIDTHDVFGDRHLRFTEIGLKPEWFYTTTGEERRGLRRAHAVIAIQSEEAIYFRNLLADTPIYVTTIGHSVPLRFLPPAQSNKKTKVIGYLGSGNPFNVASIQELSANLLKAPNIFQNYRFVLAGSICDRIRKLEPFEVIGRIDDLNDFYHNVDIVINPMNSGTGLKIKTLEALSYGNMFLGTNSALVGIKVVRQGGTDSADQLESHHDLLKNDLFNSFQFLTRSDSELTLLGYLSEQTSALKDLLEHINNA